MTAVPTNERDAWQQLVLALADDKLMLGHRNSDWTGLAPILEEDIAFSSLAQDEIAHASALYEFLAGSDADKLAFGRTLPEYRCAAIVEGPDEFDWATAVCRQFFCDHFDVLRLERLAHSSDPNMAALAKRLRAEEQVHVDHVDAWVQRLGKGTDESAQRMRQAMVALSPLAGMLLEPVDGQATLEDSGLYPPLDGGDMFDLWRDALQRVTDASGLQLDVQRPDPAARGGRHGEHSEHFKPLLDEMCEVFRLEPNSAW